MPQGGDSAFLNTFVWPTLRPWRDVLAHDAFDCGAPASKAFPTRRSRRAGADDEDAPRSVAMAIAVGKERHVDEHLVINVLKCSVKLDYAVERHYGQALGAAVRFE